MKIRIETKKYAQIRAFLRDSAEEGNWETWDVVKIKNSKDGTTFRRLIHTPKGDDQYRDIQLKLCEPSKEDITKGILFLDIIPIKAAKSLLDEDEFNNKCAVVIGRFCEIINRYVPGITEYKVILK